MLQEIPINLLHLLVLFFATYNISSLLTREDGFLVNGEPIFMRIRRWFGVKYDEYNVPYGSTFFADLFSCIKCMSRWVGLFVTLGYLWFGLLFVWVMLPFALSTVVFMVRND